MSFVFRVGNKTVPVSMTTNGLLEPDQSEERSEMFDQCLEWFKRPSYHDAVRDIDQCLRSKFSLKKK